MIKGMGSPSTPKLSLYSFRPSKAKEPLGLMTPPIQSSASVPFQWEEAPGKPRRPYRSTSSHNDNQTDHTTTRSNSKPNVARCLELPPRLLAEAKVANMLSPTTVLVRPDACRFVSNTLSFQKGGSFRSMDNKKLNKEKVKFGSSRWGSFRKAGRVVQGSFDFSTPVVHGGDAGGGVSGDAAEVKITRVRKKATFLNLSQAKSHVMASIYESFKQAVPWRRGHEKLMKRGT